MTGSWTIQYRAFLWKTFLQRLKSPGTVLAELLLPCVFMLLLTVGFWLSTSTHVATVDYSSTHPTNLSALLPAFFCQNMTAPRPFGRALPIGPCPSTATCFPFVRNGALCVRNESLISEVMFGVYYANGSVIVPTLDAYLALSAFTTYDSRKRNPTFFSRSSQASLSHYGRLLVVDSGNESLGEEFVRYCSSISALCADVLDTAGIFTSMGKARDYVANHDGEVWAILELPDTTATKGNIFTISMNYTATPWTFSLQKLFARGQDSNSFMLYVNSGFMTLQNAVQYFYTERRAKRESTAVDPSGIFEYVNLYGPSLFPMPTPPYLENSFYARWAYFMPLVAMLAALFPVAKLVSWIVEEKARRIRESMLIMGLHPSCMYLGWYTSAFVTDVVASLLAATILRIGFFSYVNYGILFFLYFSFMQQNSAVSLFLSSFFSNPRVAGAVAAFVIFVSSMPFYGFPEGMSKGRLISMSVIPCVAYSEAFSQLIKYASFGYKYSFANLKDGEYSVAIAMGIMWTSTALFLLLWLYLDQVLPSSLGRRRSPFFFLGFLRRLCCCCCCSSTYERNNKNQEERMPDHEKSQKAVGVGEVEVESTRGPNCLPTESRNLLDDHRHSELIEDDDSSADYKDNRVAALFIGLKKVFSTVSLIGWFYTFIVGLRRRGDRTIAVRDVSFAMRFGQINVLLGPNGSGKSTIMGMATGMVKPDKGDVYICGHNALHELSKCRQHIGYCPQSDIVWDTLTVEQHLAFYARMKNNDKWDVQADVNDIITAMQLEEKRHTRAENLSSGQRRRLCVGIALIGHPSVLFLDEPTAGMDMRGRNAVYTALHAGRDKRSVLISTHLLDEADRVGDRILLVKNGLLRVSGSSLFLKSRMNVGYVVTCVLDSSLSGAEEEMCISRLINLVRGAAYPSHRTDDPASLQAIPPECKLLGIERRSREISFRFPLSLLLSTGSLIIGELEAQRTALHLRSIGLSLSTLQDVFDTVSERRPLMSSLDADNTEPALPASGAKEERGIAIQIDEDAKTQPFLAVPQANFYTNEYGEGHYVNPRDVSFCSHFKALFMKRVHCAKRDMRLFIFQVILPIIFLSIALLIDLLTPPTQPAVTIDASLYTNYDKPPLSQVYWSTTSSAPDVFGVNNATMSNAFGPYYDAVRVTCSVANCNEPLSSMLLNDLMNHSATRYVALGLTGTQGDAGIKSSVVMHNMSVPHAAPQALNALYNVVNHQLFGDDRDAMLTVRNDPMRMGHHEENMLNAMRRVICGIFILLPFTFIPGNTVNFMVREKESGSRHLQWLAGANPLAFWVSSMLFDFLSFLVTEALALLVFVAFKRTEFIGSPEAIGATLALFSLFGFSSIPFSYVISFFFRSPFTAQNVVLVANFALGFLWVMGEQILGGVDSMRNFVLYTTYILRVIPSVSFGEGTFVLSGVELANLMFPDRQRPNLFAPLRFEEGSFRGGIGTGLIYMTCTLVASLLVLVAFEYARIQRISFFVFNLSKKRTSRLENVHRSGDGTANIDLIPVDESVAREEEEVVRDAAGRAEDNITLQHLTKRYPFASHASVADLSLGVHRGEIMALLGLNGAGKTTAVSVLAGEVVPTSGTALINGLSVMRSASRKYVGYCPQHDALLDNLSPREHLELYARLRGAGAAHIHDSVAELLSAMGLAALQDHPAWALSGGNRRRLSLAIALVGGTTSVLLDEPTAGMDVDARRQTCAVVKRLTRCKSVILTTHLLDETEALADRVAIIAGGRLRCVGTPAELKSRYTDDTVYSVAVVFGGGAHSALDTDVPQRLCKSFITEGSREGRELAMSGEVESVVGRTVTLRLRGLLSHICAAASWIREEPIEGLPPISQIVATQPTLEDILLKTR